jgi:5-methylcytosine-specific restriction endonuclease McrA
MRTEQNASLKYAEMLRTTQWLERRKQIIKRDNYRCLNCGSSYGLEVHHRQYHKIKRTGENRKPWAYTDHNLITLCSRCHQVGHKKYTVPVFNV